MNAAKLRDLFYSELLNKTSAVDRVYKSRDWPVHANLLPALLVSTPYEEKHSEGPNAPHYTVVTKVQVEGSVEAFDSEGNYSGAEKAYAAIEQLRDEVLGLIINNPVLFKEIQQIKTVKSEVATNNTEGEGHVGDFTIHFDVVYWQGWEEFYPLEVTPLETIEVKYRDHPSAGITLDLKK